MKKQIILLSSLALLGLASCTNGGTTSSSQSSVVSSVVSSNESKESSSSKEKVLPKTLEEIKGNITATTFNGYSFEEKGKNIASGTVSFQENELKVQGKSTYDGDTSDLFIYMGYDATTFYSIKNDSSKYAKKYTLVESVSNDKIQITKEKAIAQINAYRYNSTWFTNAILELFAEGNATAFKVEEKAEGYLVTLAEALKGRNTKDVTLNFNDNNQLISGEYKSSKWDADNWDDEKNAPIDADQNPASYEQYKVTLTLGDVLKGTTLSTDLTPYYVTDVTEFYVSSYSDKKTNNGKALSGEYVNLDVEKYSPSTAYDADDLKIISSSDESIIEVSQFFSAKALKAGKCTLTIGNEFGTISKTIEMTVTNPPIRSISLYAGMNGYSSGYNATIAPNEEIKLGIKYYPETAEGELEGISSNTGVVSIVGVSSDRTYLTVKGVAEGTAEISIRVKDNTDVTNTRKVTITVKEKEAELDATWLIGTWTAYNEVSNYDDDTFKTTVKFSSDHTGNISQKVGGIAVPNEATFAWSYIESEGLTLSSWYSEETTIAKPTKVVVSSDKATISITAKCQGYEDMSTITMALTKEEDPSTKLTGTWSGTAKGATATLRLQPNKTGTLEVALGDDLEDTASLTWSYDGKDFSLTLADEFYINSMTITVDSTYTKLTAVIDFGDEEGESVVGTFTLTKE